MRTSSAALVCFLALLILTPLTARAAAPSATTLTPTDITTNSATLRGTVNPNGLSTTVRFQWGPTTNYGNLTPSQNVGSGTGPVAFQTPLSSLLTDTNYHYRLVATSSEGITYGADVLVTPTLLLYLYAGETWTYDFHDLPFAYTYVLPGDASSHFGASVHPGSMSPDAVVRLELFGFGIADFQPPATGGTVGFFGNFYNLSATNQGRITVLTGSVVIAAISLTVDQRPSGQFHNVYGGHTIAPTRHPQPALIDTQIVNAVSAGSAVVQANINARNQPSGVFVQWGTTTNYGSATGAASVNRDYVYPVVLAISNLVPQTTYHVRTVVTNSGGTTYGNDLTLTTPPAAVAVTLPATGRTTNSALLNAAISLGGGFNVTAYFEWGLTTNYDQVTALQALGSGPLATNISAQLTGLGPVTTYHYRALAYAPGVTNYGADLTFSTTPPPTNLVVTNLATDDVLGAIAQGGTITFACDGVLVLNNQIDIGNDVCLDASGHAITFSGSNVTRIFKVLPTVTLCLTNVTLANGRSTDGGAIYNEGNVLADGCRFFSNVVVGAAGATGTNGLPGTSSPTFGLATDGTPGGPGGNGQNVQGGAIFNSGALNLSRCFFATNTAIGGAGGQGGTGGTGGVWIGHAPSPNEGRGGSGGNGGAAGTAKGGTIASAGFLKIDGCTFSNSFCGGGTGGRAGIVGFGRYMAGPPGTGGTGGLSLGGAILAADYAFISNSVFVANASWGGAGGAGGEIVWYGPASPLWIGDAGSAISGAIYGGGTGVIFNCTFFTNFARGGDLATGTGTASVKAGNATGGAVAGAGFLQSANLTLHDNAAIIGRANAGGSGTSGNSYGGSIANTGGVFQIVNSILSGGTSNNAWGTITDLGHNISSDATPVWTSGTSTNNTDPMLFPLADNGGPTWTMALRLGSPAFSTADCASAPATDQRGVARPAGPGCDIGAYEGTGTFALQIWHESTTTNVVRHAAEPGRAYRLVKSADLEVWIPVVTNIAPAGGWLEFHVPVTGSPCFYRVVAQ